MVSAIWSMPSDKAKKMPLKFFINFFNNHGLFKIKDRPQWYTVTGRSKTYVKNILGKISGEYYKNYEINKIAKSNNNVQIFYGKENEYFIYEVGVSYFSRTVKAGKKITWVDGLKSYYYLFKARFLDNTTSTLISIIISPIYMTFVGSYFGMGLGNKLFMIIFFLVGMIIGLHTKFISSLTIFLFIYIGSLFGNGQGKVLSVLVFFILCIYLIRRIREKIRRNYPNFTYLF